MLNENKKHFPARYALFFLLIIASVFIFSLFFFLLRKTIPILTPALFLIKVVFSLTVISSSLTEKCKSSWLFFILTLPLVSIPAYLVFMNARLTKKEKSMLKFASNEIPKHDAFNSKAALKCNDNFAFAKEISDFSGVEVYSNTSAKYISNAEEMFDLLLRDIGRAKRFIFLEFYTVATGKTFGKICKSLIEKASLGIDVRIIYDELGSLGRVPERFSSLMKKYGIKAVSHPSLTGTFPSAINNRNHRKIAVIDGTVAYSGGINLADEYINPCPKLKKWKDSAVRIEGEAVMALTHTFLSDFSMSCGLMEDFSPFYKYGKKRCDGRVAVFNDGPSSHYKEKNAKRIILSMLSQSEKYFTVTTPYLVCGSDVFSAIENAVRRGVRVKIIIPSKSDGFFSDILTRHYAAAISDLGADIYVYRPGFLHSKTYNSDGKYLMCGSINLDYRSLTHNFENGLLFIFHPVIKDFQADTDEILKNSTPWEKKKEPLYLKLIGALTELLAPLF